MWHLCHQTKLPRTLADSKSSPVFLLCFLHVLFPCQRVKVPRTDVWGSGLRTGHGSSHTPTILSHFNTDSMHLVFWVASDEIQGSAWSLLGPLWGFHCVDYEPRLVARSKNTCMWVGANWYAVCLISVEMQMKPEDVDSNTAEVCFPARSPIATTHQLLNRHLLN